MVSIEVFVRVKGCMRPAPKVCSDVLPPIGAFNFLNAVVLLSPVVPNEIGPDSSRLHAAICGTDRASWHRSVHSCEVQRWRVRLSFLGRTGGSLKLGDELPRNFGCARAGGVEGVVGLEVTACMSVAVLCLCKRTVTTGQCARLDLVP
jgi:hypothetical protein